MLPSTALCAAYAGGCESNDCERWHFSAARSRGRTEPTLPGSLRVVRVGAIHRRMLPFLRPRGGETDGSSKEQRGERSGAGAADREARCGRVEGRQGARCRPRPVEPWADEQCPTWPRAPPTTTAGHGTVARPIRSRSVATRPIRPRVRQLRRDGGSLRRGAPRIDPLVWKKDGSARVKGPTAGPQSPVPSGSSGITQVNSRSRPGRARTPPLSYRPRTRGARASAHADAALAEPRSATSRRESRWPR